MLFDHFYETILFFLRQYLLSPVILGTNNVNGLQTSRKHAILRETMQHVFLGPFYNRLVLSLLLIVSEFFFFNHNSE